MNIIQLDQAKKSLLQQDAIMKPAQCWRASLELTVILPKRESNPYENYFLPRKSE